MALTGYVISDTTSGYVEYAMKKCRSIFLSVKAELRF